MAKLFLWNNGHALDLIFQRPLVERILDRYPGTAIAWGCHKDHAILLGDLPVTVLSHPNAPQTGADFTPLCPAGFVSIYLSLDQYADTQHRCWRNIVEVFNRQAAARGLRMPLETGQTPMIDFPAVDISVRPNAIYVENGPVQGPSKFEFDVEKLCRDFPQFNIYCTADAKCQAPNLFDASSLNLVELSSLSNHCVALIGKGGSALACAMTRANRFKPQAILDYRDDHRPTFWEYPGNPMWYVRGYLELRQFLESLASRPHIDLATANQPVRSKPPPSVRSYSDLVADNVARHAAGGAAGYELMALRQLVHARRQLLDLIQSTPDAALPRLLEGKTSTAFVQLLESDLRLWTYRAAGESQVEAAEARQIAEIEARQSQNAARPGVIQDLLSLMLYRYPHQLPSAVRIDPPQLPPWLLNICLKFCLVPPLIFMADGEAEAYSNFIRRLMRHVRQGAIANPQNEVWRQIVRYVAENASFLSTYFASGDLKDMMADRAWIIERAIENGGSTLDHRFPPRDPGRRIRLGILLKLCAPCAEFFAMLPMLEHLGDDFEVIIYCFMRLEGPAEEYCRRHVSAIKVLEGGTPQQAETVRADDLDILFHASNLVAVTSLLVLLAAHRLARIQATSIFSVATTGFSHMDYFISGTTTDPSPVAQEHYTEKLIRLEGSIHCFAYGPDQPSKVQVSREKTGIAPDSLIFASGANMYKLVPELIETWTKILLRVPGSTLLLYPYGPNWSSFYPRGAFKAGLAQRLMKYGVPVSRLKVVESNPPLSRQDIIEVLRLADVYLDSYPFSGSTSMVDPLQLAIPPVVRYSDQFRGALGYAMLMDIGMGDLVAPDEAGYIDLAVRLGTDKYFRQEVSTRVRDAMKGTPKFLDTRRHSERMAGVFREMVKQLPQRANNVSGGACPAGSEQEKQSTKM
ncbi:MAG TPA: hypothetical protein VMD30_14100 [Tepidisphaeraceae bacterium]|nr:hypothetical protein [Tepidisphaeraceae bacterium]